VKDAENGKGNEANDREAMKKRKGMDQEKLNWNDFRLSKSHLVKCKLIRMLFLLIENTKTRACLSVAILLLQQGTKDRIQMFISYKVL